MKTKLSADFPLVIMDQSAETFTELLEDWPMGPEALKSFIRKQVDAGHWEKVRKMFKGKTTPAYRRTKK